jgi:hypothetical protein
MNLNCLETGAVFSMDPAIVQGKNNSKAEGAPSSPQGGVCRPHGHRQQQAWLRRACPACAHPRSCLASGFSRPLLLADAPPLSVGSGTCSARESGPSCLEAQSTEPYGWRPPEPAVGYFHAHVHGHCRISTSGSSAWHNCPGVVSEALDTGHAIQCTAMTASLRDVHCPEQPVCALAVTVSWRPHQQQVR